MGLFDKFKKKDRSSKENKEDNKPGINILTPERIKAAKESQDVHLYTEIIHYTKLGLAILISYTEEYFYDMIEFLSMCSRAGIHNISAQSTYEEDTGSVDNYGEPVVINHNRYYVIISGTECKYSLLYAYGGNLANSILNAIQSDIYAKCYVYYFKNLVEDGILDKDLFHDKPEYIGTNITIGDVIFMDTEEIVKKVPSAFGLIDLVHIILIDCVFEGGYVGQSNSTVAEWCSKGYTAYNKELYDKIFLGKSDMYLIDYKLIPIYMVVNDADTGDMSDADIDDIFKENYDKFSPIADELIQYEDIDEILADDEEEELNNEE